MKEKVMYSLLVFSGKLQSNRIMTIIRNAFADLLPVIITGAFATLILNVVTSVSPTAYSLAKLPFLSWLQYLSPIFEAVNYATMNMISIILLVFVAVETGKTRGKNDILTVAVAIASFVTLCTTIVSVTATSGEVLSVKNVLSSTFTSSTGMFLALIVGIVSVELYVLFSKSERFKIKLPDQVPPNIAKAFNALIPSILTITLIASVGYGVVALTGQSIFSTITLFIQTPLNGILTGLPGYLLYIFLMCFLWVFGLHGTTIIGPVGSATMLMAISENLALVGEGKAPTNIINSMFSSNFMAGGGTGMIAGLVIAILLFSKVESHRSIAKLSLVPVLFNISETMMFGLPVVLNPIFAIPFILAPLATTSFAYFMTSIGFAIPMSYTLPFAIPPVIKAFLASGGHIGTTITALICLVIATFIYAPFVLIANKQEKLRLEQETIHQEEVKV